MSKERLGVVKNKWADTKLLFSDDINWLLEQAEKADDITIMYDECKRDAIELHKQNKRYKQALCEAKSELTEYRPAMEVVVKTLAVILEALKGESE